MLAVVTWKWRTPTGPQFGPEYVNKLRSMLRRHLRIPHRLFCVTSEPDGIDPEVRIVDPPRELAHTPRCRRRLWQFSATHAEVFGPRMLCIDLDVVVVDDITGLAVRPEPIVCWRVGYAGVFSGSFILLDTGVLHGLWDAYRRAPDKFPALTREMNASDQAMLNMHLRNRRVAQWTEADGLVTWFGKGYEQLEHHGMGPRRPDLPRGARIVVMGSADKAVMDEGRYDFVRRHWQ